MYVAKSRASAPVVIALPAMFAVGSLIEAGKPAAFASAAIPALVMSGVPTICSDLRLSRTVLRPLTPSAIATTPNTISTTVATTPPISRYLRISDSFSLGP